MLCAEPPCMSTDLPHAGPGTLCNSCGIRWRREVQRREQEAQERAAKAAAVAPRHVSILQPGRRTDTLCPPLALLQNKT